MVVMTALILSSHIYRTGVPTKYILFPNLFGVIPDF